MAGVLRNADAADSPVGDVTRWPVGVAEMIALVRSARCWDGGAHRPARRLMPDDDKLKEFRENNIRLTQQLEALTKERDDLKASFEGLDAKSVREDLARLAELDKAKPHERVAVLEAELADARRRVDTSVLKSAVTDAFIRAGGRAEAADYILSKATPLFTVENDVPVGRGFDQNRPGEKLTVDSFISTQVRESAFAFKPSSGGGADPKPGGGSTTGRKLVNPTPHELGAHSAAIARGDIKVEYTT
jgi:hypothetical protein